MYVYQASYRIQLLSMHMISFRCLKTNMQIQASILENA